VEMVTRREGAGKICSCVMCLQMRKILGRWGMGRLLDGGQDDSDDCLDNRGISIVRGVSTGITYQRRESVPNSQSLTWYERSSFKSPSPSLNWFERLRFWSRAKSWKTFPYES
jgi:hypothetical protein